MGDVYGSGAHGKETMIVAVDKEDQSARKFKGVAQVTKKRRRTNTKR